MLIKFNRFAIFPVMCPHCHRYIWLEKYRRAEVWEHYADRFLKENICKECIKKFDVKIN